MPFVDAEISDPTPIAAGRVRISMRGKLRKTRLTLAKAVVEDLGWSDGELIKMQVGSGEDAGALRFEKAAPKARGVAKLRLYKPPRAGGSPYFVLALGFVAFTPKGATAMPAETCEFDVLGGTTLEVILPTSWSSRSPEVTVTKVNGVRQQAIEAAKAAVPATITRMSRV